MFDRADVVGGDVEERGHIESQAIDAVHLVRLGGDLHHQILHTVIGRLAHHAEGVHRFGCGQIGFDVGGAVKAIIDRGEQCGLAAGDGVDKRLREVRGGRLALGAGDADDRELVLRISVERGGQQAHRLTCVVDDQAGGGGCGWVLGFGHGFVDAVQILGLELALAAQQGTRRDLAGVVGDAGERLIRRSDTGRVVGPDIPLDDFTQQMVFLEQVSGRSQSQSHNCFSLLSSRYAILQVGCSVLWLTRHRPRYGHMI